ncbi:hypothetical protein K2173_021300 [Erythroxylum novogranatense]|uniref:NOMO-like N-terminal beta-sandwich domain-containing protein n=1 Tax=Erythroxylum novogranatense TaxID=1862640 RepID=A0AAV8TV15_9ROSI|nr:hypothetical protein K2173_021300 [Erythroxylum novogranatense]
MDSTEYTERVFRLVELRTVDGLVKDGTQCAPNGYYFIPVYDKGSFVIAINGSEGWSWDPEKVPVVVDDTGCNQNEDINFRFTGFTISGRVVGAVGGESCSVKNCGPSSVNVELLSPSNDVVSSVVTSSFGRLPIQKYYSRSTLAISHRKKQIAISNFLYVLLNFCKYKLRASHLDLKVEVCGSTEVELGFENSVIDDIFFIPGYELRGKIKKPYWEDDSILG